jgi:ABC-type multidrug transport system permease subunit
MTVKEISDEQIDSILQKINEKYELELSRDLHTYTIENGNARGRDIILPYAFQIIVVTAVVTMYFCIMYKKVGVMKVLGITLGVLAISQLLYLSIIAIIRIPINIFTMPLSLLIFAITIVGIAIILEKLKGSK